MKTNRYSIAKCIAIIMMVLCYSSSFSQYIPYSYSQRNKSKYYPQEHDTATTVMPQLIKTNFIYYGLFSSLNQHISIEYNKQMSDEVMLAAQVGLINSGFSQSSNNTSNTVGNTTVQGGYFEGGIKLFLNPDYTKDGRHGYYAIEGLYLKPQFVVSIFNTTSTAYESSYVYPPPIVTNNYSYTGAALIVNLGGQWIIAHSLALDLYIGAGVSFSNAYSSNEPFAFNNYSYLSASSNFPLAVSGGINVGLPL